MKLNQIFSSMAVAVTLICGAAGCATEEAREAKLQAQAKVSREDAEKTALAK